MPTQATKPIIKSEPLKPGTYVARCFRFVHIGTVMDNYMGEQREFNKIMLSFEIPSKMKSFKEGEPEKPLVLHKEFNLSMGLKSNLRKFIEGIIGTTLLDKEAYSFDVEGLVGQACLLNVKNRTSKSNGNIYNEIGAASPLMEGQTCPTQINPSVVFSYNPFKNEVFESIPAWIQEKIKESREYGEIPQLTDEARERLMAMKSANKKELDAINEIPF